MKPTTIPSPETAKAVASAHRINNSWIVRGRLRDSTTAYLRHLELTDPARLGRSCEMALEMVHHREPAQDPKPLFYAGIFGLATPEEARCFLHSHFLTHAIWSRAHGAPDPAGKLAFQAGKVARAVARKLSEVRQRFVSCPLNL
jgi:hypothetical protein